MCINMTNNKGNIKIINQFADFWFYIIGVNVIPFDTQKRIPIIYQYNEYQILFFDSPYFFIS